MKLIFALAVILGISALSVAAADPDVEPLQAVADQIKIATNGALDVSPAVESVTSFVSDTNTNVAELINELKSLLQTVPELSSQLSVIDNLDEAVVDILANIISALLDFLKKLLSNINNVTQENLPAVNSLVEKTRQEIIECASTLSVTLNSLLAQSKELIKKIQVAGWNPIALTKVAGEIALLVTSVPTNLLKALLQIQGCTTSVVQNAVAELASILAKVVSPLA